MVPERALPEKRVPRKTPGRLLPHRLGPYELFDHIGKGGMADIYRARRANDLGAVRQVVVKEVLPELAGEPRFHELLVAEAKLAARLRHSNVVRTEHLGRDEDTLYIAMEYVEGLDLRELFRRCARAQLGIPIDLALHIAMNVLAALDYAHRFRFDDRKVGIVHRDVSPSNVLLSFHGEVKLCDFGIARAFDDRALADGSIGREVVEGKAGYMSPEQARGEALDGRADVFAAGIILHEMLSGRKLYRAGPGESLLEVALRAEIPELNVSRLPNVEEIRRIVRKALARDRDDRYASAEEMLGDLERYAHEAKLATTSLRLGDWLSLHFEDELSRAARRRELAAIALGRGPVATIVVLEEPASTPESGVVAIHSTPRTPEPGKARRARSGKARKRRRAGARHLASTMTETQHDEQPKSLEGTAADIALQRAASTSRWIHAAAIAVAAIGSALAYFFLRGR